MIGKTISHYRILATLGKGGMGEVYKAQDEKLKRVVALKFLSSELLGDPSARTRFLREARAAAALDHANICTVYEIDEIDDQAFIAMACIEGESLKEKIDIGPLALNSALDIAIQVAAGLQEAHRHSIVHRDIKPANIMLNASGQAQITDFGLALSASDTKLTQANAILGTFAYMSPEQSRGEAADHRVDIWSFGVMLYEMICGSRPFRGAYDQATVHAILNKDPVPLTGLRSGVPLELERIVGKAIAKDRDHRYQHMADLLVDLRAAKASLPGETDDAESDTRTWSPAGSSIPKKPRRLQTIIGGALAGLIVVVTLLYAFNIGNIRRLQSGINDEAPIRSLAVLPFDNMMGDAEQDFFVEGMHETLITALSKIGTLRIISRTSAMHFQKSEKSIPEIARELDVDALVEGSVLRVGDRVRITAQLIRGATDEHLWAEEYDRSLHDILSLLSEVAREIAAEIDIVLTPNQVDRLTRDRAIAPEVYELYLRGLHHLHMFNENGALEARRYFQQAIDSDPEFAQAHAGLSGAYIIYGIVSNIPPQEAFTPARAAALRALELDPYIGVAHTVLGYIDLYSDWDLASADREFHKALEADPNDGDALHGLAVVQALHGHSDRAVELVLRARQADPYSYLRNVPVWVFMLASHRYQDLITDVSNWRAFSGDAQVGWHSLYQAYYQLGRHEDAMVELRHSPTVQNPETAALLETAYAESGIRAAFRVYGERLAILSESEMVNLIGIASYFALAGDADRTFAWLEKSFEEKGTSIHLFTMPALDPYRADPRFKEILRRLGIPESGWE